MGDDLGRPPQRPAGSERRRRSTGCRPWTRRTPLPDGRPAAAACHDAASDAVARDRDGVCWPGSDVTIGGRLRIEIDGDEWHVRPAAVLPPRDPSRVHRRHSRSPLPSTVTAAADRARRPSPPIVTAYRHGRRRPSPPPPTVTAVAHRHRHRRARPSGSAPLANEFLAGASSWQRHERGHAHGGVTRTRYSESDDLVMAIVAYLSKNGRPTERRVPSAGNPSADAHDGPAWSESPGGRNDGSPPLATRRRTPTTGLLRPDGWPAMATGSAGEYPCGSAAG